MAGGFGTRLHPLTEHIPKPLIEIFDRPAIDHCLAILLNAGITRIGVTTSNLPEMVEEHVNGWVQQGLVEEVHITVEETPMGTAGGIKLMQDWIEDTFVVVSGDNLTSFDLAPMISMHRARRADASMALWEVEDPSEFGIVDCDDDGQIVRFQEKPAPGEEFSQLINAGLYILQPEILDQIPEAEPHDFSKDLFPSMLQSDQKLYAISLPGTWYDIGRHSDLARSQIEIASGRSNLAEGVMLDGVLVERDSWQANTSQVDASASLEHSVIHAEAFIGELAEVSHCIVMRGARVESHAILQGLIIPPGHQIRSNDVPSDAGALQGYLGS
mgnify:CR=1 FL=1